MAAKRKRETGLAAAVERFVSGLDLEGAEDVVGRLAIELARALEEAPGYSKARLAHELRDCVTGLGQRSDALREQREQREKREAEQRVMEERRRAQPELLRELGVAEDGADG
jgi:hypothetical protein